MKSIVCFGELLIDFLNFNTAEEGGFQLPEFRQYPGGAPANVAAAVGRLGGPASFLGQVGDDRFGRFLKASMEAMRVDMRYLTVHKTAHTPLAFVFLDDTGERSFEFLRHQSADVLMTEQDLPDGAFENAGLFHFCSNTLTDADIAATTKAAIAKARAAGAVISFDVNLRHNLWPDHQVDAGAIQRFLKLADIVKVSREEADWIEENGFALTDWLETVSAVWVTDGGGAIRIVTRQGEHTVEPPKVQVVDTTAGGDAFTGGLLQALNGRDLAKMSDDDLAAATRFAAACGGVAVSRAGALPSLPEWQDVERDWPF
ncbi:carbohydrate kinase family protein [Saccharospirillum salsuginis]|uniref:Fructokinase n=1 Tax=Saccharospirillum salsuginis TaxID=418750 RepID=A0A918N749_9GAMM|nr:carbohydrate kinase [Saccharospirillum salsuginis]GGX49162.1 fructokinase [Saccharospirillum salsuginis]